MSAANYKPDSFGLFVAYQLKEKSITQKTAALVLGVGCSGFSKKIKNRTPWTLQEAFSMLEFLELSFSDYLDFDELELLTMYIKNPRQGLAGG